MKRIDYSSVDWTRHDAAIARDLGVTRAAVGKARLKAGVPPSKRPVLERLPSPAIRRIMAFEVCRMIVRLDEMGMEDVIPEWMHKSWRTIADTAEKAVAGMD